MERPDTIWYRMNWVWRIGAVLGLVGGLACGTWVPYLHFRHLAESGVVSLLVVSILFAVSACAVVIVYLCWVNLIGSGKYAELWAFMWLMSMSFVERVPIPKEYGMFSDPVWWRFTALILPSIQIWVGLEAGRIWRLGADPSELWYSEPRWWKEMKRPPLWVWRLIFGGFVASLIGASLYVYPW